MMEEAGNPMEGIGEIHKETDHNPSRQEELDWKKEQLRQKFGTELFDKLFNEAKEFFRLNPKCINER